MTSRDTGIDTLESEAYVTTVGANKQREQTDKHTDRLDRTTSYLYIKLFDHIATNININSHNIIQDNHNNNHNTIIFTTPQQVIILEHLTRQSM